MKRAFFYLILTCSAITTLAQEHVTIRPSGNIISREIPVQSFNAIEAKGLFELILTQGDKESVKIEADDNLQSLFSVENRNNKLIIDMPGLKNKNIDFNDKDDRHEMRLKVYVTFRDINTLEVGVIGNVHSSTPLKCEALRIISKNVGNVELALTTNKLVVENKGVGNIQLSGNATEATVTNNGVGQFNGESFIVQTMDIDNSGVGKASVNVEKSLKVKESFLGKVTNKGNAKTHMMDGVEM
jgi:hypothetical protein